MEDLCRPKFYLIHILTRFTNNFNKPEVYGLEILVLDCPHPSSFTTQQSGFHTPLVPRSPSSAASPRGTPWPQGDSSPESPVKEASTSRPPAAPRGSGEHPDNFPNPLPLLWLSLWCCMPSSWTVFSSSVHLNTVFPAPLSHLQRICDTLLSSPNPAFLVVATSLASQILDLRILSWPPPPPWPSPPSASAPHSHVHTWDLVIPQSCLLPEYLKGYLATKKPSPSFLPRATFSIIAMRLPPEVISQFIFFVFNPSLKKKKKKWWFLDFQFSNFLGNYDFLDTRIP